MRDIAPFFRSWLHKRREVASVIPSSPWLVKAVRDKVASDTRQVIVEFGPGTGPVTRGLLKEGVLTADSKVILVESNDMLARYLKGHFHDPRITIEHDTAANVRDILERAGETEADAVISGIPYSYFDDALRDKIVHATADALKPHGKNIVYQVRTAVEPTLRHHFASVKKRRVWFNVPPLHLFEATQPKKAAVATDGSMLASLT